MNVPGPPSQFFIVYIVFLLPWLAMRSARRLRAMDTQSGSAPLPARQAIWVSTMMNLGVLLFLAWFVGRDFGFEPFYRYNPLSLRDVGSGIAALVACFALRGLIRLMRSESDRKRLLVFRLAPRTTREWWLWGLTIVIASIAEEIAYRGVAMSILHYSLGNGWIAALICAAAFAAAHWMQGAKSGLVIFGIALVMHALVAATGTLIIAMIVHAAYDFVAGYLISVEAKRFELEPVES